MNEKLLRSHQASQQTNFRRVRDQHGLPAPEARLYWDILNVSISPYLPRFQAIEIEALSIRKNHQSGFDVEQEILFCVESHVFAGENFESKWRLYKFPWLKPICFSEYLKQFLELWNALKPFRMRKHFWNPIKMVRILFENPLWKCLGEKYSPSLLANARQHCLL